MKPVLLWTNPNPGATFAAQSFNLNLADYDEIQIETYHLLVGIDNGNATKKFSCFVNTSSTL